MSQYKKGFLKVVIIGDSGVGKTSILESLNYKKISKSAKPTIGAEFMKKKIIIEDGNEVNLQLWDTAGGADCCVLVFDVTSPESYSSLDDWRQTFVNTTGDNQSEIPIVIIGNKSDKGIYVEKNKIQQDWIDANRAKTYIEASALNYVGIEEAFQKIAQLAFNFQQYLRDNDKGGLKHQIINVNQLRKGQKLQANLHRTHQNTDNNAGNCGC